MNQRERFVRTLTCSGPDRPSYGDYLHYQSTQERWEREGLPVGLDRGGLMRYFGFDHIDIWDGDCCTINRGPLPGFAEQVLEETADYTVSRVRSGDVVRVLKHVPSPAMPQFLSHAVTDRKSWEDYRARLDPCTAGRFALPGGEGDLQRLAAASPDLDTPLGAWLGGTYGFIRDFMGVENASLVFYDDPALVEDMIAHLTDFYLTLFRQLCAAGVQLDWVMFWEDMAYNHGSLVSPELYVRTCMPFYFTIIEALKAQGIPVIMLDSDGNVDELIPIWVEAGINVMHPLEVASGMDVREVRKEYGTRVSFLGGIDKRALAAGRAAIDAEVIPKVREMQDTGGGFIAECDHAVPPDVSLENYLYFRNLVRELSE